MLCSPLHRQSLRFVLVGGFVRRLMVVFDFVVVIEITAEDREQTQRIVLALWTAPEMAGHFDGVLGHNELVDFFSLPQFFFEQLCAFVTVGNLCTEAVAQLVIGNRPIAVVGIVAALPDGIVGKPLDFVLIYIDHSFL